MPHANCWGFDETQDFPCKFIHDEIALFLLKGGCKKLGCCSDAGKKHKKYFADFFVQTLVS